jgi:hypothetical protein
MKSYLKKKYPERSLKERLERLEKRVARLEAMHISFSMKPKNWTFTSPDGTLYSTQVTFA